MVMNRSKLAEHLQKKLPKLKFVVEEDFNQITVYRGKDYVFELFYGRENTVFHENDLEDIQESGKPELVSAYKWFLANKGLKADSIHANYGPGWPLKLLKSRRRVMQEIKEFGNCFHFDEGVHPEFIPPPQGIS